MEYTQKKMKQNRNSDDRVKVSGTSTPTADLNDVVKFVEEEVGSEIAGYNIIVLIYNQY